MSNINYLKKELPKHLNLQQTLIVGLEFFVVYIPTFGGGGGEEDGYTFVR